MNYLLNPPLSCFLLLSATAVMAAGEPENSLATLGKPLAVQAALPSVHVDVGGNQKKRSERVSIEGFWPLMQQEQLLLFLQGGWLRQQQRNLLSAGLGWHYFLETDWGVGSNLFYDQDITRQHRRVGLGAEAWWQSLTLTANGYFPTSSWRTAHDLKATRERPAQGYDVSLKGYLPAVPHPGASVRYAHYFGNKVALGGSQQRHRNPKQWRWGVDVTPIPLLTLAYHHQPGLSGPAKHQISAALTYRFSLPLSQQLDPNQVTGLHSAQGQRLARVQREQLMALQYAKIALPTPPKVLPKKLTREEIKQYKESIEKAMKNLRAQYRELLLGMNHLGVNLLEGIEKDQPSLDRLTSLDAKYNTIEKLKAGYQESWAQVSMAPLDSSELNEGLGQLKALRQQLAQKVLSMNLLQPSEALDVSLNQLRMLSYQYAAEKTKENNLTRLKKAYDTVKANKEELETANKELAAIAQEVRDNLSN